jgi:transketolase
MRKQFSKTSGDLLDENDKVVILLGDIGVFSFRNHMVKYPNRVINIGILEQSTIGLSSGLSKVGLIPIVHTIAPFMVERAYEQLKIDFGYQNLNGNFISIGSSYDYASLGPTHHCPGDIPILKNIPNMQIIIPGSSKEFDRLFKQCYDNGSPTYYRLSEYENELNFDVDFGKAIKVKSGSSCTIIVFGNMLDVAIESTKDMDVTILYYTTIYPFDFETLNQNINEKIVIIESFYEGSINLEITKNIKIPVRILNIGIPIKFLTNYGSKKEHDENLGFTPNSINKKISDFING